MPDETRDYQDEETEVESARPSPPQRGQEGAEVEGHASPSHRNEDEDDAEGEGHARPRP